MMQPKGQHRMMATFVDSKICLVQLTESVLGAKQLTCMSQMKVSKGDYGKYFLNFHDKF